MTIYRHTRWFFALGLFMASAMAAPVGSGFTYQGELKVAGAPANAAFDFEFALFNVAAGGAPLDTLTRNDLPVGAGLFTTELDYTDVPFAAAGQYWLEVRVRDGVSSGGYQQLLPRHKLTPTPYAVNARTVQAGGVNQDAIAAGAVGNAQLQISAVGTPQIANLTVTNAKIADATITNVKIADATITAAKLADATITDAKIADATITAAKLAFAAGDVTAVTAGSGLMGGGGMGDLDLAVDTNLIQARVTGSCPIGEYVRGIAADGAVVCESILAYLGITLRTVVHSMSTPLGEFDNFTAIAAGSDGLPVISYFDNSAGALKVAKCVNAACTGAATITTVANPGNVQHFYTSIAVGSDGLPVVSYFDDSVGALKVAQCVNAACTGTATITTIDDPVNNVGYYNAIAIGSDGLPVIAYQDLTARTLKVAKCLNAACTGPATITTVDDPANSVGFYTAIAIGSGGLPVISYLDVTAGALKVAKCLNAACTGAATITTVDDPANSVGSHTSIAIGNDALPVISYLDSTAGALKVVKCLNAACTGATTITTVDDPPNSVGYYTAIAIGDDGLPVISYLDSTASALKVAKCLNAACIGAAAITTVDDSANSLGYYTAIAIGGDGLPVVSYFDATSNSLKVAKCGTLSCQ